MSTPRRPSALQQQQRRHSQSEDVSAQSNGNATESEQAVEVSKTTNSVPEPRLSPSSSLMPVVVVTRTDGNVQDILTQLGLGPPQPAASSSSPSMLIPDNAIWDTSTQQRTTALAQEQHSLQTSPPLNHPSHPLHHADEDDDNTANIAADLPITDVTPLRKSRRISTARSTTQTLRPIQPRPTSIVSGQSGTDDISAQRRRASGDDDDEGTTSRKSKRRKANTDTRAINRNRRQLLVKYAVLRNHFYHTNISESDLIKAYVDTRRKGNTRPSPRQISSEFRQYGLAMQWVLTPSMIPNKSKLNQLRLGKRLFQAYQLAQSTYSVEQALFQRHDDLAHVTATAPVSLQLDLTDAEWLQLAESEAAQLLSDGNDEEANDSDSSGSDSADAEELVRLIRLVHDHHARGVRFEAAITELLKFLPLP